MPFCGKDVSKQAQVLCRLILAKNNGYLGIFVGIVLLIGLKAAPNLNVRFTPSPPLKTLSDFAP